MRSTWLWTFLTLGCLAAVFGGWRWLDNATFQREFSTAEADLANGRTHAARKRLLELRERRPESGEVAYNLGLCEEKLGHLEAALTVWSRIAVDSPLFVKASVGRALTLMNTGRYSLAEDLVGTLPPDAGPYAGHLRQETETLLRLEGRAQEARELILESWPGSTDPSNVLKRLYDLDVSSLPVDYLKEAFGKGDPNDDRVWLGQANLAIWSGRFDEATRLLDACVRLRPDDQAVWLSRLSLAMSSRDVAGARDAIRHVKAAWFLPFEVLRIRAWLAGFVGDNEAERRCLLALVVEEPGNTNAWARLAESALEGGNHAEVESFRKKQAETSALRGRYTNLMAFDEPGRHIDELCRLAQELGRPIEARGWSLIKQGRAASEPLWPDQAPAANSAASTTMLASRMADLIPVVNRPTARPPADIAIVPPVFTDDADAVGLRFFHDAGGTIENPRLPETMCGGVGLLDYDGDGWLDVYAVQGGPYPPVDLAHGEGDRLFRNRGDGTFEDVTERAGVASFPRGYGHGVAVGDYNNDGWPDLFVTRWGSYALYRNRGNGRFEDVTGQAGLAGSRDWPTSAAFADLDGDGDIDLYVCHYLLYDPSDPTRCGPSRISSEHKCIPRNFPSRPDHVFRNDNGRFVDVTSQAGLIDHDGRGLGVVAADLDDDNKIDLYVANDMSANYLFRNLGAFRFEERAEVAGAAASSDGLYKSGMGIACGDVDGNGSLDLAVTNYFGQSTTFYQNLGQGLFADHTASIGLVSPSRPLLGFGIAFPDVNNDGWLDLISTNGHVFDARPSVPLMMRLELMVGGPGRVLTDVSARAGEPFQQLHLGRGLAVGDLDNDGRLDALVVNQREPLVYLHNRTEHAGHFIRFGLSGRQSNRDGVGTRVTIVAGGRRRMSERTGGGSYQSANDPRLHFGLGTAAQVESVEVRWPSGRVDRHEGLIADREYRLCEGAGPRLVKESQQPSSRASGLTERSKTGP
jgi:enediyne biosynthesis protein E4